MTALHRRGRGRRLPSRCRCPNRAPATTRRTASGSSTRRASATSARRSATAAGRQRPVHLRPEDHDAEAHHRPPARRPRSDVDRRPIYFTPIATARSTSTPTTSRSEDDAQLTRPRRGTCAGRARTTRAAHRLRVERRAAGVRHEERRRARRSRSRCPTTDWRDGPSRVPAARSSTSSSARRASARSFAARGDIFTAPIEKGPTRNLTRSSGAHDKWPRWSPDGSRIAFISDPAARKRSTWSRRTDRGKPEQLTNGRQALRYAPEWSLDGKHRVRRQGRPIYRRDRRRQELTQIVDDARGQIRDYVWSPRGHTWRSRCRATTAALRLRLEREGRPGARVTDPLFNAERRRGIRGQLSLLPQRPRVRAADLRDRVQLRRSTADRHLRAGAAQGRRASVPARERRGEDRTREGRQGRTKSRRGGRAEERRRKPRRQKTRPVPIAVSTSTASPTRVARVPRQADNYDGLSAKAGLALRAVPAFYYGRDSDRSVAAHLRSRTARRRLSPTTCRAIALSADGAKVLVRSGGTRAVSIVRRRRRREPVEEDGLDGGPDGRPRPGRGVGADLRRGLAPLPRLLLRREHARLRLGGAAHSSTSRCCARRAPLRPELRDQRDDRRADRSARLHRRRRLRHAAAAPGRRCPARASSSTRPAAATGSPRSSAARTKRRSIARRSPRSASTQSAITCWRSTARS